MTSRRTGESLSGRAADAPTNPAQTLAHMPTPVIPVVRSRPLGVRVRDTESLERRAEIARLVDVAIVHADIEHERRHRPTLFIAVAGRAASRIARPPPHGVPT